MEDKLKKDVLKHLTTFRNGLNQLVESKKINFIQRKAMNMSIRSIDKTISEVEELKNP